MLFFFKEKPIEIVTFINSNFHYAREFTPVVPAIEAIPDWWKKTPRSFFDWDKEYSHRTVKSCPGIVNVLKIGMVIPLWTDIALQWNEDRWKYIASDKITIMHNHDMVQTPGFYPNHWHTKISSPWLIETPVKLMVTQPTYLRPEPFPFITPYGIIEPIKNLAGSNIFLFLEKKKETTRFMLKVGMPLLHIIPITEKKVNYVVREISDYEYRKKELTLGSNNHFVSKGMKNAVM